MLNKNKKRVKEQDKESGGNTKKNPPNKCKNEVEIKEENNKWMTVGLPAGGERARGMHRGKRGEEELK